MKVGITAAGGFLGRYVCENLLAKGHHVVGIDSRPVADIELTVGRVNEHDLTKVFNGCEVIIHLEWSGSFRKAADAPLNTVTQNISTLHRTLEAAKTLESRFIFASSGIVYGGNLDRPTSESEDVCPRSYYGLQKLHAEGMVRIASELGGFDAASLRVFNLYGKGTADPAQIIPRLRAAFESNQPFRLTGDGLQQRDFIAVEDAAEIVSRFATKTGLRGDVFNLGSGVGTTMRHLAETFYDVNGVSSNIEWVASVPGESRTLIANMDKTVSETGYAPKVRIQDGLAMMLGKKIRP